MKFSYKNDNKYQQTIKNSKINMYFKIISYLCQKNKLCDEKNIIFY